MSDIDFDALKVDFIELLGIVGPNPGWHSILHEVGNLVEKIAHQTKLACNSDSIYAEHRCFHNMCEERAEYIACDGFGRILLVCQHHYEMPTCNKHFSHCPPGRK